MGYIFQYIPLAIMCTISKVYCLDMPIPITWPCCGLSDGWVLLVLVLITILGGTYGIQCILICRWDSLPRPRYLTKCAPIIQLKQTHPSPPSHNHSETSVHTLKIRILSTNNPEMLASGLRSSSLPDARVLQSWVGQSCCFHLPLDIHVVQLPALQ